MSATSSFKIEQRPDIENSATDTADGACAAATTTLVKEELPSFLYEENNSDTSMTPNIGDCTAVLIILHPQLAGVQPLTVTKQRKNPTGHPRKVDIKKRTL